MPVAVLGYGMPASPRVVVALGGNALARAGQEGDWSEAIQQMRRVAPVLAALAARPTELVLTHGNGPQVGRSLRQNELARREVPPRPLDVLGAETQGQIGYLIAQELTRAFRAAAVEREVLALVSRVLVSPRDPAFRHPTKPIGQRYTEPEARLLRKNRGWTLAPEAGGESWRRVVASPEPIRWLEGATVRRLLDGGLGRWAVPVVTGGGGIPVIDRGPGRCEGVEAVIDKDRTAALVAETVGAATLVIVTDVPAVMIGYRKPWERPLGPVGPEELRGYLERGEFGEGSMAPKVEAVLRFLSGGGDRAIITDPLHLAAALEGRAGTRVASTGSSPFHRPVRPGPTGRSRSRTGTPA